MAKDAKKGANFRKDWVVSEWEPCSWLGYKVKVQLETNTYLARVQLHHQTANRHCKYMAVGLQAMLFIRWFMSIEISEPQLRKEIDRELHPQTHHTDNKSGQCSHLVQNYVWFFVLWFPPKSPWLLPLPPLHLIILNHAGRILTISQGMLHSFQWQLRNAELTGSVQ